MNCREFLKRMPELLDRDPDPDATDDLLNHAGVCPKCAAELEAALNALSAVSPSFTLKASPGLKERTMKRILTLDSQPNADSLTPAARGKLLFHPWRYVAAATAALVLIAVFNFKGGGSNAFAQVVEQLSKLRSCTYTLTVMMQGLPNMQMKTAFKEPGMMRMETLMALIPSSATSIIDMNKKKLVVLVHPTKQCLVYDLTGDTVSPGQDAEMGLFEELRQIQASGAEPIGTKQIGGIEAAGFRVNRPGIVFSVWTDPDQPRILLVEYEMANFKGGKGQITDFVFDPPLDDSFFSLDPPEGYTVTDGQALDMAKPSEETFIRFLRKTASETEGNLFLPSLDTAGLMKAARSRRTTAPNSPMGEFLKQNQENTLALMFAMTMTDANDFHYAGEGVALGDAATPICWYKPTGSQNYRVIYGDLSARDAAPGEAPTAATKDDKATDGRAENPALPSEEAFIKLLRIVAEKNQGDLFPSSLDQAGLMKTEKTRKATAPKLSPEESAKVGKELMLGLMFAMNMTDANDFHYAGEGVAMGSAETPICWYKPTGARNYRVIYGDLSVRDVAPEDLPPAPGKV